MKRDNAQQVQAGLEVGATENELKAALLVFEAECFRGDPVRINRATEAAHAALQSHLDAKASNLAVARRSLGF